MKHLRFVLLGLLALAALFAPADSEVAAGPSGGHVGVRPEVLDALGQQPEVAVIVSLREPQAVSVPPNVAALKHEVAASQGRVLSVLTTSDFTVTHQYEAVPALAGRVATSGVDKLAAHPDVVSIAIDAEVHASLAESVPLIGADVVQAGGITGAGIEVAVLDTGIDTDHPDLSDDLLSEECFLTGFGLSGCPVPGAPPTCSGTGCAEDDDDHGSHVSGIITSGGVVASVGVAPDAGIRAYKVLDSTGTAYSRTSWPLSTMSSSPSPAPIW